LERERHLLDNPSGSSLEIDLVAQLASCGAAPTWTAAKT
jgi:hypothetical protein